MPLECPRFILEYNTYFSKYNACLDCRNRHDNQCWYNIKSSRNLSDILTIEERINMLEDKQEVPEINIVTITKHDYQQLQRLLLSLQEKLNSHIEKTQGKNKDRI